MSIAAGSVTGQFAGVAVASDAEYIKSEMYGYVVRVSRRVAFQDRRRLCDRQLGGRERARQRAI
jgi:hypothetical protein